MKLNVVEKTSGQKPEKPAVVRRFAESSSLLLPGCSPDSAICRMIIFTDFAVIFFDFLSPEIFIPGTCIYSSQLLFVSAVKNG